MRTPLLLTCLALLSACSGSGNDELNGELNSGKRDAAVDGGAANGDAGAEPGQDAEAPADSGLDTLDAGELDAGELDASELDAAEPAPDSSVPDAAPADAATQPMSVYSLDFEQALPAQLDPGAGVLTPSQGFAPLGPEGNTFGPTFLRSPTTNTITLTISELPVHSSLSLEFLFAAIDSLDGSGAFPAGDYLRITVDGVLIFEETFANATETQIQTYEPPPGVLLARHQDLGFVPGGFPGSYYSDSAYNLGADPQFQNIPHTASSAVITFSLTGGGVQGLDDESWAIDNVRVLVGNTPNLPDAGDQI